MLKLTVTHKVRIQLTIGAAPPAVARSGRIHGYPVNHKRVYTVYEPLGKHTVEDPAVGRSRPGIWPVGICSVLLVSGQGGQDPAHTDQCPCKNTLKQFRLSLLRKQIHEILPFYEALILYGWRSRQIPTKGDKAYTSKASAEWLKAAATETLRGPQVTLGLHF